MGEYARDIDEYEDYDGYDDYEDEEERQEEEGEEEYEEAEERKPTAEELEYLELRARLKEQIRKKMQRESSSSGSKSLEKKKKVSSDNYGSFFGPSQPVIAHRVIQESKSLLENQHLALRMLNSQQGNKKRSSSAPAASVNGARGQPHKVNEQKVKIQKLKDTRDYSFLLSDDAELPAPTKKPAPQSVSTLNSEARSAPLQQKNKLLSSSNSGNNRGGREDRKPVSTNGHMNSKVSSYKPAPVSKSNPESMNSKRQLGSNAGTGPGRPSGQKNIAPKAVGTMEKKAPVPGPRNILPASHKPSSSKVVSSMSKQAQEQKRQMQEPSKAKVMPKHIPTISSRPQTSKPVKHISSHASLQDNRPKKKPVRELHDDEDEKALSMIRRMFNTQRFQGRPDDDSDMEANFDDILREEKRSAKIARKEDEEQLRLIEEEERRERMRKLEKKRKLSQR